MANYASGHDNQRFTLIHEAIPVLADIQNAKKDADYDVQNIVWEDGSQTDDYPESGLPSKL